MKRWLSCIVFLCAALPSIALAGNVTITPAWERPIERRPIFTPPTTFGGRTQGGVFSVPYGSEDMRGAQYTGPAQLGTVNVNVVMQMRNEIGLQRYAMLASSPSSLYYRRFLTPGQIADFFGASAADYELVKQYFWSQGLAVQAWKQREMLRVVGPQAAMERAFGTHFGWYRKNGVTFYAPTTVPHFSRPLAVSGIGGMVTYRHFRKHFDVGGPFTPYQGAGAGFAVGYSWFDVAAAFDYTGAYNINGTCCKGDGITIGIVGTGPISAFDVPEYRRRFGLTTATGGVNQINVTAVMACCYSSPLATPPPVTGPCAGPLPGCNPEDNEAQLDTEQTSSLAPNATVNFYLAYNPHECGVPGPCSGGSPQLGIGETDDELQQIASDNVADVVSGSYGIGELDFAGPSNPVLTCPSGPTGCTGGDPTVFATLAAEGIAVFISSGDTGASGCQRDTGSPNVDVLCVSYPSGDINVVSVGGTTTPIGNNGHLTGPITTWGAQTQTFGAGGGGFSSVLRRPGFEPAGRFCASNGTSCDLIHRLQPDLSLNADPATGVSVTVNCGSAPPGCSGLGGKLIGSIGGTSASAPDSAAMWALVLEACKQTVSCATHTWTSSPHPYRLGNPAPLLYALSGTQKASSFYDVVFGFNAVPPLGSGYPTLDAGYNARIGYDLATGLGAPFARNLIKAIVGI
ncbi:MAG TPA: protease pro-enzyme activation domain-containing protein [Candidatus Acidoferrales bacterium]|nr:protease pro-enzyme activation domain-containing protein [Candidatus Acidoferrales bacterium]